jgi:murein DD-endopeptidase MepM/ murein hydrolase activator NlpD
MDVIILKKGNCKLMKKRKSQDRESLPKLRRKYKLVLRDAYSYEEKISFFVSRLGVIVITGTLVVVLVVLTIYLVAFTSLREYIPGYTDIALPQKVFDLQQQADSLNDITQMQEQYLENIRKILLDDEIPDEVTLRYEPYTHYDTIELRRSAADSLLRLDYERTTQFNLYPSSLFTYSPANIGNIYFYTPLNGIITRGYDPGASHFGVDIAANRNEAIKAILDGTVIFSDWTLETGYIVCLQHQNQLISVYKHNSSLLRQQGELVKAGETISFVGGSGELSTGPHLHFELWYDGNPVDPEEFISF